MVTILTILAFLSSFLSLSIVVHTFQLSRRSSFTLTFALFVLCQGIWSFAYMMLYPATDMATIRFWYLISGFGWIPLHSIGIHFILVFTQKRRILRRWWVFVLLYLPPAVMLFRHVSGVLITADFGVGSFGVYQVPAIASPWFWIFLAYSFLSLSVRIALLVQFISQGADTTARKHAGVLLLADVLTVTLVWLANYLLPATGLGTVPSLGAILISILPLAGWYIIRKKRFLTYNLYFRFQSEEDGSASSLYREIFDLESIFGAVHNGVALIDNQYRVFRRNSVLDTLLHTERRDSTAPCYSLLYGRNAPCEACPMGLFESEESTNHDTVQIDDNGSVRTLSRTMFPVREASGRTSGTMEILRDISEEVQTREEHAYLLHAVENTPAQIFIADFNGRIRYANSAFRTTVSGDHETVRGTFFWTYFSATNSGKTVNNIREAVSSRREWTGSIREARRDGSTFVGRLTLIPMIDTEPSYLLAYIIDRSEEDRVRRMREDVERTIRHDLKNPLTAILGVSEILVGELSDPENREMAQEIHAGAKRMRRIIDSSAALRKMEDGIYVLQPDRLCIDEVVQNACRELESFREARELRFVCSLQPWMISGEAVHLQQLFSNILKNAAEASPQGGAVTVSAGRPRPDTVAVSIHNDGTVPEEVRETLFNPYVTFGKAGGSGLGLYSSQLIAAAHKGAITFESSDTSGTTFVVALPAAPHHDQLRENNNDATPTHGGRSLQ